MSKQVNLKVLTSGYQVQVKNAQMKLMQIKEPLMLIKIGSVHYTQIEFIIWK